MRRLGILVALVLTALAACSDAATPSGPQGAAPVAEAPTEETPDPSTTPGGHDGGTVPGSEDGGPTPTDGGKKPPITDGGGTDAAPLVCNSVPRGTVTPVAIGGFADLKGGTISPGSYKPTAYKRYISGTSNTTFPPISLGVEVQGNTLQFSSSYGGSEKDSYTFTTTGSKMVLTRTCPGPGTLTWYFDAAGDTLTIYGFPGSNDLWYATLQRQP